MIDFLNNLPEEQKRKIPNNSYKGSVASGNIDFAEMMRNISGKMKMTLPQKEKPQQKEHSETERVRRGESTQLF